jgi:predicted Zn-dependent protease with MMP-like domain
MGRFEDHVRAALDSLPPEPEYLPARISIYRQPLLEDFGDDPAALEREIRITVLHELAHYFGIDEDRLDELGYA